MMAPLRLIARRIPGIPIDAQRRKFLVAFGIAFLGIGFSYVFAEPTAPVRYTLRWIPVPFWLFGVVWMLCGATSVLAAFLPTARDKPGFWALAIPPSIWTAGFFIAAVATNWGYQTAPRPFVSAMVFWVVATAIDTVSAMADASLLVRPPLANDTPERPEGGLR